MNIRYKRNDKMNIVSENKEARTEANEIIKYKDHMCKIEGKR
jgi:hypothetical protein